MWKVKACCYRYEDCTGIVEAWPRECLPVHLHSLRGLFVALFKRAASRGANVFF